MQLLRYSSVLFKLQVQQIRICLRRYCGQVSKQLSLYCGYCTWKSRPSFFPLIKYLLDTKLRLFIVSIVLKCEGYNAECRDISFQTSTHLQLYLTKYISDSCGYWEDRCPLIYLWRLCQVGIITVGRSVLALHLVTKTFCFDPVRTWERFHISLIKANISETRKFTKRKQSSTFTWLYSVIIFGMTCRAEIVTKVLTKQ